MITRKDLAKYKIWRHATSMGLKELKIRSANFTILFSVVLVYRA